MFKNIMLLILVMIAPGNLVNLVYAQDHQNRFLQAPPVLSNSKVDQSRELSELKTQAYVGIHRFSAQHDNEWVEQCLNLGLDQKKFGCKIVAYRIQWFSGQWSGWFVPGVNDLYKKSFEPLRRFWACFNDHNFEIIYMADKKIDLFQKSPVIK